MIAKKLKETGWSTSEYPEYAAVVFEKCDDENLSDSESEDGFLISEPKLAVRPLHCLFPSRSP